MREVGVQCSLPAPDVGHSLGYWSIYSNCQKRLLDLELNLDSSVITFDTLQWALTELERIEEQRQFSGPDDDPDEDKVDGTSRNSRPCQNAGGDKVDDWAEAQTQGSERVGTPTRALGSGELRSATLEGEKYIVDSTGLTAGHENLDELLMHGDKNYSSCSKVVVDELKRAEFQKWRKRLNLPSGPKRKSEEEASSYDSEKRARVREFQLSRALIDAVTSTVRGRGGKQMSHRINSRLELPECVSLTNLVSHCLLVSLDQIPEDSVRQALARTIPGAPSGVSSSTETVSLTSEFGEWMWLHRWFVRNLLPGVTNDTFHASLDWLVAYMTASHSGIMKFVLDDLFADLSKCEVDEYRKTAIYTQRTGVLEYAALREPEHTSGSLLAVFSTGFPPTSVDNARESMEDENKRPWAGLHTNIWLGLMVLCPTLFSAFARLWVPTLTVEAVIAWSSVLRSEEDLSFLPAVWNILGVSASEEPKTRRAWLCAAMIKRLSELAPIASHVVLLLSALCDISVNRGTSQGPSEVGYYLLEALYQVLSKHVLPSVLGVDRDSCADASGGTGKQREDSGVIMFLETLREHAHLVWRAALDSSSVLRYPCCTESYTGEGQQPDLCENGSNTLEKFEGTRPLSTQDKFGGGEIQRGYLNRDPLIQLCQLLFLCCTEHVVADLLASATWIKPCQAGCPKPDSLKRLLLVKKMMQVVVGQGRGSLVLEVWTQRITDHLLVASDEQALGRVLAVGQLLDLKFWQVHDMAVSTSFFTAAVEEEDGHESLPRTLVWNMLRAELDAKWLPVLSLMHREGAWDLRLAVLGLLQQLPPISSSRSQAVASRLKGVLGLYFSWLETFNGTGDLLLNERVRNQDEHGTEESGGSMGPTVRWQYARAMQHLRRIIIKLASCSYPSFTLMVNRLLDFSFEHCPQISTTPSPCSSRNTSLRMEPSATPLRRLSSTTRTSFSVAPLSSGRLDRYGKLTLVSEWAPEDERSIGATESSNMQLYEENSRIQSGGLSSLHNNERERFRSTLLSKHSDGGDSHPSVTSADDIRKSSNKNEVVGLELGNLLRRTLEIAISESGEASSPWPCRPLSVLSSLMTERLETPHEVLMTMEQYEEILPKHISSLRHIFLAEYFSQNALLMEMLELVVKHGENREVLRCVEFVRVLLADSISRWHSTFRTRRSHSTPPPKVDENEARSRMHVHRLIQLVASAGWLPQPLASSGEVVAVIDGADIADLLLLVWRCMHHAVAFGSRGWGGSSSNLAGLRGSTDGQGLSGGNEEAGKEGTYTEWESHYFSILRQNVAQIGPHFAQVYPLRRSI